MYLGNGLAVQSHHNTTELLIAMLNVEVDLVRDLGTYATTVNPAQLLMSTRLRDVY